MSFNIAIDGPAGAGKSTIAKKIAKELGFVYVDTGAMYRAMALYFLRSNISNEDEQAISRASENVEITIQYENGEQQVFLNGENVSGEIRKEEVGNMASKTSGYGQVRKKLVELQQQLAKKADVVMDGRDIGTAVLPNAEVKIFLVASVSERAERRFKENQEKGIPTDLETLTKEIQERDHYDSTRDVSPLKQAEDAVRIDTTGKSIPEVVAAIKAVVLKKGYLLF